jgi:hypothetical protein
MTDTIEQDTSFAIQSVNPVLIPHDSNNYNFITEDSSQLPSEVKIDSLFKDHSLKIDRFYPDTIQKPTPDWFTVIIIFLVMSFTCVKIFYSKILFQILNAFVNNNTANQIIRDENILVQRASILLSVICYVVLALFAFKVSDYYEYHNTVIGNGFSRFLFIALFIALAYSLKMIALKIFGFIINKDKPVASYIFNLFLINNVLGIVLLPILLILTYVNFQYSAYMLFGAIGIVMLFFLYRLFKGILIWTSVSHYNLLYLFLYICALEIAPLLIIIKIIML